MKDCSKHWAVQIEVNGEIVLTIGHNSLSGVDDIDRHSETIRTAANHLLSFVGDVRHDPYPCGSEEKFKKCCLEK